MKTELKEVRKEFGKHSKLLCSNCRKLVSYSIMERKDKSHIHGITVEHNKFYGICDECKSEIYVPGLEDNNMDILEAKYKESRKIKEMHISIDKIWIFEIQDGISGGIIIADSEDEARKKLSLDRGIDMPEDICAIYPLSALDLNKDVHDLW